MVFGGTSNRGWTDVNAMDHCGCTALYMAARFDQKDVLECLLAFGADPNTTDPTQSRRPLSVASVYGHVGVMELLIAGGAEMSDIGQRALHLAARHNHADVVRLLLRHGCDPNRTLEDGSTALMWAALNGSVESLEALLGAGADTTCRNTDGLTAEDLVEQDIISGRASAPLPQQQVCCGLLRAARERSVLENASAPTPTNAPARRRPI